ncbi:MAG: family 43 glycosylhydrolase, partial [Blastochloris sp.]|nr:family 43 glycosylhydrolase [Blastochloris sp.]
GAPEHPLQKSGHASLLEMEDGQWFLAHLCSRPVGPRGRCILGRETALQKIEWTEEGWPILAHGGNHPALECPTLAQVPPSPLQLGFYDDFSGQVLQPRWNSLREATEGWLHRVPESAGGGIRLEGRCSLASTF